MEEEGLSGNGVWPGKAGSVSLGGTFCRNMGNTFDGESCSLRTCLGIRKVIRLLAAFISGSVKWVLLLQVPS